jgi:benzil reductase ((S)-benzoin forming)
MLRRVLSMAAHAVAFERAIVTGAGSGIGRATAAALCERGLEVYGVGRREGALRDTATRIGGDKFHAVVADVSTPEGRGAIADRIDGAASTILVHNAATTGPLGPLDALTLDGFRATMASNVEGPLFLTKALMPKLARGSRVLHVSTGGAHQGFDGMLSYCASKAALRSVYESLRDEHAGRVCFGSAQPGVVATEMMRGLVRRRCGTCFTCLVVARTPVTG